MPNGFEGTSLCCNLYSLALDESVLVFVVCADLLWGLLDGLSDFLFGSFWL